MTGAGITVLYALYFIFPKKQQVEAGQSLYKIVAQYLLYLFLRLHVFCSFSFGQQNAMKETKPVRIHH